MRAHLARKRISAWSEVFGRRRRDRVTGCRRIQALARIYLARCAVLRARQEAERMHALRSRAASRIQSAWRGLQGKSSALR